MKVKLKNATISLRVPSVFWDTDPGFAAFLEFVAEFNFVEEYAFFSTPLIGRPFPVDYLRRYWEKLGERIEKTRAFAPRVGINHLVTLGHNYHGGDFFLKSSAHLVNHQGVPVPFNFCPVNPVWREEYVKPTYTLLARCRPDFIWIDDDLRLQNHGPGLFCYCSHCMPILRDRLGFAGGLPELKAFLEVGTPEELRRRRLALLDYNRSVMVDISSYIEKIIHGVDPKIILGQMDSLSYWEHDRPAQAAALAGPEKIEVWWRPGGSTYSDRSPDDIIIKANSLAASVATMPESVTAIQGELESFHFPVLGKSRRFTSLEAQLYCAASGCTGVAYSILGKGAGPVQMDPLAAWKPLVQELKRNEEFIDLIVENNRRLPLKGIWNGIGEDYFLGNNCVSGPWFDLEKDVPMGFQPWRCTDLNVIGLPPAFRRQDAAVTALGEREVAALSDEDVFELLHGGLYLDVPALEAINHRGFEEYTGFKKTGDFHFDSVEAQVEHFLNDYGNLYRRDVVQIFWGSIAYSLAPAAGAQTIGRLVNIIDDEIAECSSGIFTNKLGGRIAAIGYAPWHGLGYAHKAAQVKKIFRWLSDDTLPGWVDSCHRSGIWVRQRPDGGINATVLNASMDTADEMVVALKTLRKQATLYRLEYKPLQLTGIEYQDGYTRFELPDLEHWSIGYLVTAS
jgi:hypothetical protein